MYRSWIRLACAAVTVLLCCATAVAASGDFRVAHCWPSPTWKIDGACGVAVDGAGNAYVADTLKDRVLKFDAAGRFVLAWGTSGSADGTFKTPYGITVNKAGTNVYVADTGNHRIQQFTSSGQFVRKWGKVGGPNYSGSGPGEFDAPEGIALDPSGNVYVADTGNARIQKFSGTGTYLRQWGRPGSGDSLFLKPSGVAVSPTGAVYVCDRDRTNSYIQQFDSEGGFVRKWAGWRTTPDPFSDSQGLLRYPSGIAVGEDGSVYVTETGSDCVTKYTPTGTFVLRFGASDRGDVAYGGQPAMRDPLGIAVLTMSGSTKLFVCDTDNDRVRVFTDSGVPVAINGSWGVAHGRFDTPAGIAVLPNGAVVVGDRKNDRLQQFRSDGAAEWAVPDDVPSYGGSTNDLFDELRGLAGDGSGNIYVADTGNHRVKKVASNGAYINKWGVKGTGDGFFDTPCDLAVGQLSGSWRVFVADTANSRIQVFDTDGIFLGKWGRLGAQVGEMNRPEGLALDPAGNVYVADTGNHRIQKFSSGGAHLATWGGYGNNPGSFSSPSGVALDAAGNVYVADTGNHRIQKLSPSGAVLAVYGSQGTKLGQFDSPKAIDVAPSGVVYVADTGNHRVQALAPPIAVVIGGVIDGGVYNTPVLPTVDFIGSGILQTRVTLNGSPWTPGPLATSGRHTLVGWARDAAAENSSEVRFTIDTQPPVTMSDARIGDYSDVATVTLNATDDLSGVNATYWRLGSGASVPGTTAVLTQAGTHTLSFWSTDRAGNSEAPRTAIVRIVDGTPPVTTSDARAEYADVATITLTPVDASLVPNTYYRVDGGPQQQGRVAVVRGTGQHTLQFWSVDERGNTEAARSVTFVIKRGAGLSVDASASRVSYQGRVTIRGELTRASDGVGLASRRVELYRSYDGVRFNRIASASSVSFEYSFVDRPVRNATYQLRFPGDTDYAATLSATRLVRVKASLSAPSAPLMVLIRKPFAVSGTLHPGHPGSSAGVTIRCYRRESGVWRLRMEVAGRVSTGSAYSVYRSTVALPSRGEWRLRAYHSDGDHAATLSPSRTVTARSR